MKRTSLTVVGIAVCSIFALAACAGGSPNASSAMPASAASQLQSHLLPLGNDTRFFTPQDRVLAHLLPPPKTKIEKELFVSSTSDYVVILKDKTYKEVGELTNGVTTSDGVWVDSKGNVYVANVPYNVVEFSKGGSSPACTYTGASDPINETTDAKGNVYVADFEGGFVDEYAQCSNSIVKQFAANAAEGVAVDASGDLFVAYGGGSFEEFVKGSTTPTPLGATVGSAAGLILDKHGNLIADDQTGSIDVIAPPYSSAKVLVSGLSDPFHCALNKKENLLFNADSGSATVTVYKYPSGTLVTTLGSGNGITEAEGVGESPDAVF
jgi:hypothetical protein